MTHQSSPLLSTDARSCHDSGVIAGYATSQLTGFDLLVDEGFGRCKEDNLSRWEPSVDYTVRPPT